MGALNYYSKYENFNNNNIIESNNFNKSKTNKNSQIKESITNPKLLITFGEGGNMISGESLRIKSKNATIKANAFEGNIKKCTRVIIIS